MDKLKYIEYVANNPIEYARKWKEKKSGKVLGTFCSYVPEEIIFAAGVLGFRIFGTDQDISKADAHLQAYSCSLVRSALEDALAGNLNFLDGTVFPHTCDSIQRLSDIWRLNTKTEFHIDTVMPVKLNTTSAQDYMLDVVKKFRTDLETKLNKEISDRQLKEAVIVCNEIRKHISRIYEIRYKYPSIIQGSAIHCLVKASMVMDRIEFLDLIIDIVNDLENKTGLKSFNGKRLVLTGGMCNIPDVYTIIENAGGAVLYDDLCTGNRYFGSSIDTETDIMAGIARKYLERIVCPAKHSGIKTRAQELVKIVKQTKADGVICLVLKFCDPHSFDYPYIKNMLNQENIPCMFFELEKQFKSNQQFQTRCEAFIEML